MLPNKGTEGFVKEQQSLYLLCFTKNDSIPYTHILDNLSFTIIYHKIQNIFTFL